MSEFGILPITLVAELQKEYGLRRFVETGTAGGDSCKAAATHFNKIITIELQPSTYIYTSKELSKQYPDIQFLLGNTLNVLPEIVKWSTEPTLYWVDAHWAGSDLKYKTYANIKDGPTECPLLRELDCLIPNLGRDVLLIDDARLFLDAPNPDEHDVDAWPSYETIATKLQNSPHKPSIKVIGDVIVVTPNGA